MRKVNPLYYILIFSFLARLIHINFPVSGHHEWRQADTASIAKNFYENGFRLFYPEVNWGGLNHEVESEFQLYPFIVSLLYFLFGFSEVFGRLVSIICSLFTICGLYLLVRDVIDKRTALWSSFIYAILPMNIYFSRVIMPEPMFMMFLVFTVYYFYHWVESDKDIFLILSCLFTTLAVLIKIPNLYIGLPLCYLAYQKYKLKTIIQWKLLLFTLIVFVCAYFWYHHAYLFGIASGNTFQIWAFGIDKWGNFNLWGKIDFYNDVIFKNIAEKHLTYPAFIICIFGFFIKREHKYEKLFDMWSIALFVYIMIVAQGNQHHDYYQLPVILPLAVYIGKVFGKYFYGISKNFLEHKLQYSLCIFGLILILALSARQTNRLFQSEDLNAPYFKIADEVKKVTNKDDLIITVSNGNPIYLYSANRKGWIVQPVEFDNNYLSGRIKDGAKLFTGEKKWLQTPQSKILFAETINKYKVLVNNEEFFLIDLRIPSSP